MKKKHLKIIAIAAGVILLSFQVYFFILFQRVSKVSDDFFTTMAPLVNESERFYQNALREKIEKEPVEIAISLNQIRINRGLERLNNPGEESSENIRMKDLGFLYSWQAALAREKCDNNLFENSIEKMIKYFGKYHGLDSREDVHKLLDITSKKRKSAHNYCIELK